MVKKLKYTEQNLLRFRRHFIGSPCLDTVNMSYLSFTTISVLYKQGSTQKLSDQQLAVNQGQNPLPIYLSLNVKDDFSTLDFKGNDYYTHFYKSEDFLLTVSQI